MDTLDLGPATATMRRLLLDTTDDQLTLPTPCPDYAVGDLAQSPDATDLERLIALTGREPRTAV